MGRGGGGRLSTPPPLPPPVHVTGKKTCAHALVRFPATSIFIYRRRDFFFLDRFFFIR